MRRYRVARMVPYAVAIAGWIACAAEPPPEAGQSEDELLLGSHEETLRFDASEALARRRPFVLGARGWQVQSSAIATHSGEEISQARFSPRGWLPVWPDDAGAPGTVINALLQNGECPDVFFSDNMRTCFGFMPQRGPVTVARFAVPWWFRTEFTLPRGHDRRAKLTIPGVVGEGDVWLNGTRVASREIVAGAYASHTFDVTALVHEGRNALAIEMYPNDPTSMFTLDNVDWTQIPPDNQTGIQFPIQLQLTAALHGSNAHVVQRTAADLASSALTIEVDVTNDSDRAREGLVSAAVIPPRGAPIIVREPVTIPAHTTQTVALSPDRHPELRLAEPHLWWPHFLGAQPLYRLRTAVSERGDVSTLTDGTFGIRTVSSRRIGQSPQGPVS